MSLIRFALQLRLHDRQRRHHHLDAPLCEVGGREIDIAVGDLLNIELLMIGVGPERKLGDARHQAGIELARIGARRLGKLADCVEGRVLRHRDHHDGVGGSHDRAQIVRIIWQLAVHNLVGGEVAGRNIQQDVIVVRTQERRDRDDAVAARTVLDHHRLPPLRRQFIGKQTGADVGGCARSERHDEPAPAGSAMPAPARARRLRSTQRRQAESPQIPMLEIASEVPQVRVT